MKEHDVHPDQLENFERAFTTNSGGCRRTCLCKTVFFHDDNIYTWEPGELEQLRRMAKSKKAFSLDYSVNTIQFEGDEYVVDCICWRPRAARIIQFVESHVHQLARYINSEKERWRELAERYPHIKG